MPETRVLLAITKPNWGGAQAYVYALATKLKEFGCVVTVAYGGGKGDGKPGLLTERLADAGVPTRMLPSLGRDIALLDEFRAFAAFCKLLKKEKPDVLHLNSSKAGGLGALAGRLCGVRTIIFTAHGWAHREPRPFHARLLIRLSSWATILLCHRVIVVSRRDHQDAPVLFSRRKIVYIPNGIEPFSPPSKEEARKELLVRNPSLPLSGEWIFMASELHKNKGVDFAISAFATLVQKYPNVSLVIGGEGEERKNLEELISSLSISDRVFLIGFDPNVRMHIAAGDIFLLSSRKEGLPYVLLEAAMSKLPIVASDTGGVSEIVTDTTGIRVPVGDIAAISDALSRLLNDPELRLRLGNAAHEHVRTQYGERRMLEATAQAYR